MSDDDLDWMIESRSRVQRTANRFLKAMRSCKAEIGSDDRLRSTALLGTGACFSLWRAIYLVHADRQWVENLSAAECFLDGALRMTSILFSDDTEPSTWTFGYYLNSAFFRLCEIFDQVPEIYQDVGKTRSSPDDDSKQVWDRYCESLETIAGYLEMSLLDAGEQMSVRLHEQGHIPSFGNYAM